MAKRKKDENERKAEAQQAQAELAEAPLTEEQQEAVGAGRETGKDRVDKKPAKESKAKGIESGDTPSALALDKVGDAYGDDWKPKDQAAVVEQGEAYAAEKAKHRWG